MLVGLVGCVVDDTIRSIQVERSAVGDAHPEDEAIEKVEEIVL